jgi:predicted Zn-dependent protease with MMP-like domain
MIHVSDEQFEELVSRAVADIPKRFADHLENVSFMVASEPSREQLGTHVGLHGRVTLLGLYEGIPLPLRNNGYSGVLPDIITIFKQPHEMMAHDLEQMRGQVHQTVWHEVAHYFGLGHGEIHALEHK